MNKQQNRLLKNLDEVLADPRLLKYKILCHKCKQKPIDCTCRDRWIRLSLFHSELLTARAFVCLGNGTEEEQKLIDKFGI